MSTVELAITALAAGGDGVGRDPNGRVTFVPRAAIGDRVRARIVKQTKSFARADLMEVIEPGATRVAPPCAHFREGCGGCQWQHVARAAQLEAKQTLVANALRGLAGVHIEPIADPCPPLGWRRRARFHVMGGKVGLFALASHRVLPIASCPQLEPELDAALHAVAAASPPDGELALVRGQGGAIAVGIAKPWRGAAALVGRAGIAGVTSGDDKYGNPVVEIDPGVRGGPWDFAQASAAGNAALVEQSRAALGKGPGRALELYAGAGNLTRAFRADGWDVVATDVVAHDGIEAGTAEEILARVQGPFDAIVLDPPRTGALEAIEGILRHAPATIVYISCDPATLARDAQKLVEAGYRAERAWPVDLMPQTSHVEVVLRLIR